MWGYLLKARRFHGSYDEHVAENLSRCDYSSATETKSLQWKVKVGFSAEVLAEIASEHLAGMISIIVVEMVFRLCAADRLNKYAKGRWIT
jgi:hypothetical protein